MGLAGLLLVSASGCKFGATSVESMDEERPEAEESAEGTVGDKGTQGPENSLYREYEAKYNDPDLALLYPLLDSFKEKNPRQYVELTKLFDSYMDNSILGNGKDSLKETDAKTVRELKLLALDAGIYRLSKEIIYDEARDNLKRIGEGAVKYFETHEKRYPDADEIHAIGDEKSLDMRGMKNSPADSEAVFSESPWNELGFRVEKPHNYIYMYDAETKDGQSRFQAKASASLSEHCDSIWIINGYSDGTVSEIKSVTDVKCDGVEVPHKDEPKQ